MSPGIEEVRSLFEVRSLWKAFDGVDVLRGVELRLQKGDTLGIIGPSGAGKTVLLKCMVGLFSVDRGDVLFEGRSVGDMTAEGLQQLRRRVGFLFQGSVLFDSMTVRENLEYALRENFFRTMGRVEMSERVAWALDAVGLARTEAANMPADLSGGMRKRVGIARTIVTRPDVLLYDCPTEGLDPPNAHRIADLIVELRRQMGITSILVSHDLRTTFTVCDRVAFMNGGQILETGSLSSLAQSENVEVRDFVLGHPPEEPMESAEYRPPEPWKS